MQSLGGVPLPVPDPTQRSKRGRSPTLPEDIPRADVGGVASTVETSEGGLATNNAWTTTAEHNNPLPINPSVFPENCRYLSIRKLINGSCDADDDKLRQDIEDAVSRMIPCDDGCNAEDLDEDGGVPADSQGESFSVALCNDLTNTATILSIYRPKRGSGHRRKRADGRSMEQSDRARREEKGSSEEEEDEDISSEEVEHDSPVEDEESRDNKDSKKKKVQIAFKEEKRKSKSSKRDPPPTTTVGSNAGGSSQALAAHSASIFSHKKNFRATFISKTRGGSVFHCLKKLFGQMVVEKEDKDSVLHGTEFAEKQQKAAAAGHSSTAESKNSEGDGRHDAAGGMPIAVLLGILPSADQHQKATAGGGDLSAQGGSTSAAALAPTTTTAVASSNSEWKGGGNIKDQYVVRVLHFPTIDLEATTTKLKAVMSPELHQAVRHHGFSKIELVASTNGSSEVSSKRLSVRQPHLASLPASYLHPSHNIQELHWALNELIPACITMAYADDDDEKEGSKRKKSGSRGGGGDGGEGDESENLGVLMSLQQAEHGRFLEQPFSSVIEEEEEEVEEEEVENEDETEGVSTTMMTRQRQRHNDQQAPSATTVTTTTTTIPRRRVIMHTTRKELFPRFDACLLPLFVYYRGFRGCWAQLIDIQGQVEGKGFPKFVFAFNSSEQENLSFPSSGAEDNHAAGRKGKASGRKKHPVSSSRSSPPDVVKMGAQDLVSKMRKHIVEQLEGRKKSKEKQNHFAKGEKSTENEADEGEDADEEEKLLGGIGVRASAFTNTKGVRDPLDHLSVLFDRKVVLQQQQQQDEEGKSSDEGEPNYLTTTTTAGGGGREDEDCVQRNNGPSSLPSPREYSSCFSYSSTLVPASNRITIRDEIEYSKNASMPPREEWSLRELLSCGAFEYELEKRLRMIAFS